MMRLLLSMAVALFVLSSGSAALAQGRVVVREFQGPGAKRARAVIVEQLSERGFELVANADAENAAAAASSDLGSASGRVAVATKLRIAAFIEGEVQKVGNRLRLRATAYAGSDGRSVGELQVAAPRNGLPKQVADRFWAALGQKLQSAEPPAPAESVSEAHAPSDAYDDEPELAVAPVLEEEDEPFEPTHSPLDFSVGARFGTREFSYNDAFPGLRGYELGMSPNIALQLRWYPAAHFSNGFLAHLGLDLRGEMLVGVKSRNSAGQEFATRSEVLGLGLRMRLPLRAHELAAVAGYGSHTFAVRSDQGLDPDLPSVAHRFVRLGGEGRLMVADPISLQLRAAYLLGLGHGQLSQSAWFPNARGNGVEAEVGVGYALGRHLELLGAVVLQRYFLSLDPQPTDPGVLGAGRVAGGALDQFLSMRFAALYRM